MGFSCQTREVEKNKNEENKISNPNDAIIRLDEKLNKLDSNEDSMRQFLKNKEKIDTNEFKKKIAPENIQIEKYQNVGGKTR